MTNIRYSDEQIADFLELAADVGIGRAIRVLGYPNSWITGKKWADNHGVVVEINQMKAKAKSYDLWYTDRDVLLGAEAGMERVMEQLQESDLTPDDMKKLSESYQKFTNVWLTVQGKANTISESHHKDGTDLELTALINEERARQHLNDKMADSEENN